MKKKAQLRRLVLHRETVRHLNDTRLEGVAGGLVTGPHCPLSNSRILSCRCPGFSDGDCDE